MERLMEDNTSRFLISFLAGEAFEFTRHFKHNSVSDEMRFILSHLQETYRLSHEDTLIEFVRPHFRPFPRSTLTSA